MRQPKWSTTVDLPPPLSPLKGKRVIVSQFLTASRTVTTTQSIRLSQILETATAQDVSFQLAAELNKLGIPAEAIMDAKRSDIGEDQILIRGAAAAIPSQNIGRDISNALFFGCSLTIFGCILPNPVADIYGAKIRYHVEIIDSSGKFILQSGDKEIEGLYEERYIYEAFENREKAPSELVALMPKKIAEALVPLLQ